MKGPGWGNPSDPSAPPDAGLRETTANSIARWRRRFERSAQLGLNPPHELDLTEREAAQLRELARARGATQLASHLDRIVVACSGPPGAAKEAVEQLADQLRALQSGAHAVVIDSSPPPMISRGPSMAEPSRIVIAPSVVEPPRIQQSLYEPRISPVQSVLEPPLLQVSEVGAKAGAKAGAKGQPRNDSTLLSAQGADSGAQGLPAPVPVRGTPRPPSKSPAAEPVAAPPVVQPVAPPPMVQPVAPPPMVQPVAPPPMVQPSRRPGSRVPEPSGLPDSLNPPPPLAPKLVGTVFGFRAFGGRKSKAASQAAAPPNRGGILGLPGRIEPIALPDLPHRGLGPRGGSRPSDPFDPRSPRRPHAGSSYRPQRESTIPRWSYFLSGGIGLLAVGTAAIIAGGNNWKKWFTHPSPPVPRTALTVVAAPPPTAPAVPAPSEVAQRLVATVHKRGAETPELRALLDTQGRLALACKNDPASCGRGWTPLARDTFNPISPASVEVAPVANAPLPAWLQRLKMPQDFPVRDDPVLRAHFDFNTKNIAGRQRLQAKFFECAAYEDIFDSTLVKYGAPGWLTAVVYQESDCNPRATSEVGAKGLWQFMPESARAYGLRVVEGDVDERLNPVKSTEAAIHFLTDLQRKLGSWDLVLAAYNMGPFAVLARLSQVGETAGFWDLVHAGVLPEETAQYVPAIEAYALVIQNLGRLQFSRDGKRLEATAEIVVKPGTRLSLIARAASTTTLHIRELNPEFLLDVVPEGETSARVPDAEAHRAQAFFETWSPDDNRDTCVPEDFDWGAKQFDTSKFAHNCPHAEVAP